MKKYIHFKNHLQQLLARFERSGSTFPVLDRAMIAGGHTQRERQRAQQVRRHVLATLHGQYGALPNGLPLHDAELYDAALTCIEAITAELMRLTDCLAPYRMTAIILLRTAPQSTHVWKELLETTHAALAEGTEVGRAGCADFLRRFI